MRRTAYTRVAGAAILAATALVLAACGGSGSPEPSSTAAAPSSEAPRVPPSKVLTAAELPAGLQYREVKAERAEQQAIVTLEAVNGATYDPAECKEPNVHASRELQETRLAGQGFEAGGAGGSGYAVTLLPGDVKPDVFAAAGTGRCAQYTLTQGGVGQRRESTREALPPGAAAEGFVLVTVATPVSGGQTGDAASESRSTAAYFTVGQVTAIVTAGGPADRAVFDDLVARTAAKLAR